MPNRQRQPATSTETTTSAGGGVSDTRSGAQDLLGNGAVQEALARGDSASLSRVDPLYTGIVHIGMGDYAHDEARNLNQWSRSRGGVKGVRQRGEAQDVVVRAAGTFDLTSAEGRQGFIATLAVPPETASKLVDLLEKGGGRAKDEIAQVIEVYVQAESGIRDMQRVVLSGHSVGDQIWGDHNGDIDFAIFEELATIFPRAAGQVRHLMLSACYTGGEATMQRYHTMFPKIESIVAYDGSSPGTWSGALPHLKRWETRTADGDGDDVERSMASGTRKGDNMATWNKADGYQGQSPMSVSDLESQLAAQQSTFDSYFRGETVVTDAQNGPLRQFYNLVQRALSHPETPSARVVELRTLRDQTIRLLFWGLITNKFSAAYKPQLAQGYQALGRPVPDFTKMTRAAALAELDSVASAGGSSALLALLDGLVQLDTAVIPTSWV